MKLSTSKIASLTLALAGYAQSTAILVSYNAYTIYEANPHQELWLVGDPPPTTCGVKIAQMCEISNTGASCSVDGSAGTYTGTITAENTNGCNNGENVVGGRSRCTTCHGSN